MHLEVRQGARVEERVMVRVDQDGTFFLLKLLKLTQNSRHLFIMSLGVSIKNTTKRFCEILPGTDQARHIKFFFV